MKSKQLIQKGFALATLFGLSIQVQAQMAKSNLMDGGVVEFPLLTDSYYKNPEVINLGQLNLIDAVHDGMNKEQVRRLMGNPHFKEGLFNVRVWNYVFRLKQVDGNYQTCQYQLHFTERPKLVDSMYKKCTGVMS